MGYGFCVSLTCSEKSILQIRFAYLFLMHFVNIKINSDATSRRGKSVNGRSLITYSVKCKFNIHLHGAQNYTW